jgi:hypothetical protein
MHDPSGSFKYRLASPLAAEGFASPIASTKCCRCLACSLVADVCRCHLLKPQSLLGREYTQPRRIRR